VKSRLVFRCHPVSGRRGSLLKSRDAFKAIVVPMVILCRAEKKHACCIRPIREFDNYWMPESSVGPFGDESITSQPSLGCPHACFSVVRLLPVLNCPRMIGLPNGASPSCMMCWGRFVEPDN